MSPSPSSTNVMYTYPRCSRHAHIDSVYPNELHIVQQSRVWRDPSSGHALRPITKQGGHADESALPDAHAYENKIPTRWKLSLGLLSEHKKDGFVSSPPDDFLPIHLFVVVCICLVFQGQGVGVWVFVGS